MKTAQVGHLDDLGIQNQTGNSRVNGKVYDDEQFTQQLDQIIKVFNTTNGTRFSFPKNLLLTFLDLLSSEGITAPFVLVWPLDKKEGHPELVSVCEPGEWSIRNAATAHTQTHPAFDVWRKLTLSLVEVIQGKRDIETAFNVISIRDCLPQHTLLATTWHIDDIRKQFPFGTSDEELYQKLLGLESSLQNVAVSSGNDVIENLAYVNDVEVDNGIVILNAWAIKNAADGYGDTFIDEKTASDAMEKYGEENIRKGFVIIGGSSISPYIEENFLGFYEHMLELMKDILKHPGMENYLTSDKESSGLGVEVGIGTIVFEGTAYSMRRCSVCHCDFVLESSDDPSKDGPRQLEFDDICDNCISQGLIN
ncbi:MULTISPECIES: hypothetical protein [unclassified Paenibacillus]|uniref:Uncharacterized protein n=1 Tax=Paenibacillus provencensis TaxID=441151 RepID=A0ABW3Q6Z1_9BACL|nr:MULTISPECIES: hypothetical protein [unclassified Paenibacillus]MCM3130214.1 hypothetical protein [Paenibacillus sp. MER 78]SDX71796.1 hypothetical protein SAMN05518848_112104 [Paenibacillus sp. PDC88]SFS88943.1 hypothetical protein SAMN04488601_106100 [Paenibacillus sp. 453mf]